MDDFNYHYINNGSEPTNKLAIVGDVTNESTHIFDTDADLENQIDTSQKYWKIYYIM